MFLSAELQATSHPSPAGLSFHALHTLSKSQSAWQRKQKGSRDTNQSQTTKKVEPSDTMLFVAVRSTLPVVAVLLRAVYGIAIVKARPEKIMVAFGGAKKRSQEHEKCNQAAE